MLQPLAEANLTTAALLARIAFGSSGQAATMVTWSRQLRGFVGLRKEKGFVETMRTLGGFTRSVDRVGGPENCLLRSQSSGRMESPAFHRAPIFERMLTIPLRRSAMVRKRSLGSFFRQRWTI